MTPAERSFRGRASRFRAAKVLIEDQGWCQGAELVHDPERRYGCCAATAICAAMDRDDWDGMLMDLATFQAANGISPTGCPLGAWNDAPERTVEEVYAAFDRAIAACEQASAKPVDNPVE